MTSNGDLVRDIEMSTNGSVERSTMDASSVEGQPVHSNSTNSAHQPGESATNKELKVPTYLKVLAAIIATFFMIAVFVCAVLSKTSFMAIASRMYLGNSTMHCDDHELVRRQSVAFVQLMIVLCVPQAFTALRTLFFGVLKARDTFPWPSLMAFMLGAVVSVIESAALSAFALLVATQLDPGTALLLVPGIFTHTSFVNMAFMPHRWCRRCRDRPRQGYSHIGSPESSYEEGNGYTTSVGQQDQASSAEKKWRKIRFLVDHEIVNFFGFVLQLGGLLGFTIYLCVAENEFLPGIAALACGLTLSVIWSEHIQRWIFTARKERIFSSNGGSSPNGTPNTQAVPRVGSPQYPASRKAGFVYSLIRLVCIPIFCTGFTAALQDVEEGKIVPTCWNWYQGFNSWMTEEGLVFAAQVLGGLGTWFFALCALWSTYQPLAFTLPLLLATPASIGWYWISQIRGINSLLIFPFSSSYIWPYSYFNDHPGVSGHLVAILFVTLFLGQLIALGSHIWRRPKVPVSREQTLFLSPYYDGVFLDSYLLLNRRNGYQSQTSHTPNIHQNLSAIVNSTASIGDIHDRSRASKVFICSTMYHEREHEMRQMLKSIYSIAFALRSQQGPTLPNADDEAVPQNGPYFESHIFFDDAVSGTQMNSYAFQLMSLLGEELKIEVDNVRKVETPYGYQLHWKIEQVLPFCIHLKDSAKVKKKKRWSQVMYMEYITRHLMQQRDCQGQKFDLNNTYILTTDADIQFTTESVAALLDFLARDGTVGAVCARTHPLGSGPIVWYQKFEYAFGHWFQKSAEHVLGCVLCCPGCFSVFRVKALESVLDDYETIVTSASEFLTKDMGEDRWLCTLLIKKGWRLEYAALAQNRTYCPDSFDEFYNQRRRWVPSTVANLIEVVQSARTITTHNDSMSYLFILYQIVIIFTTLVAPATVVLIVSSGLEAAFGVNTYVCFGIMSFVAIAYGLICLYTPEKLQLNVAKVLTFVFAIIMAVAFVGLLTGAIEAIPGVSDYNKPHWLQTTLPRNFTNSSDADADKKKNEYLASLPNTENRNTLPMPLDAIYLLGFLLLLTIAAFLNFNEFFDLFHFVWYIMGLPSGYMLLIIYSTCNLNTRSWGTRVDPTTEAKDSHHLTVAWHLFLDRVKDCFQRFLRKKNQTAETSNDEEQAAGKPAVEVAYSPMDKDMQKWLKDLKCEHYAANFEDHGYTRKDFAYGMTLADLQAIGVTKKGFQLRLIKAIKELHVPELENSVAKDVPEFLIGLHLSEYQELFEAEGYASAKDVDNLLHLTESDLLEMGITKRAHLKQLMSGLKRLKYPSSRELKMRITKAVMDDAATVNLKDLGKKEERNFWKRLVDPDPDKPGILKPEEAHWDPETDVLKRKLEDLRTYSVLAVLMFNIIWVALVFSFQIPALEQWGIKPAAFPVLFLVIYFSVLLIQFLALIAHRVETLLHVLARTNMPKKAKGDWYHWQTPDTTMTVTYRAPAIA